MYLPLSGLPSPYVYEKVVSAFGDLKANNMSVSMSHGALAEDGLWIRIRIESEDWRRLSTLLSIRVTQTLLISSIKGGGSAPKTFKQSHRQPSALSKSEMSSQRRPSASRRASSERSGGSASTCGKMTHQKREILRLFLFCVLYFFSCFRSCAVAREFGDVLLLCMGHGCVKQ